MSEEVKEQSNSESKPDSPVQEPPEPGKHQVPDTAGTEHQLPDTEESNVQNPENSGNIEYTGGKKIPDNAVKAGHADGQSEQSSAGKPDTGEKSIWRHEDLNRQSDQNGMHRAEAAGSSENAAGFHVITESTTRQAYNEENTDEDEALFDDEEDQIEKPHFHFRFPKVRILTRKIAEQERIRKEAAQNGDSDAVVGQDNTDGPDEERVIWIPARLVTFVLIIAVVLAAALAVIFGNIYWKYSGYEVVNSKKQEDTLSAGYCRAGDNILRYSTDGASLLSQSGSVIWDVSYSMNNPQVAECDNVVAIYDKDGTNIVVCDESGQIGSASTSLPIIRAKVCDSGAVAALQQDSTNAYIEYYDKAGDQVAQIKTSMDNPGYPLDFALSNDGQNIAVSYLGYVDSKQTGIVRFYNFGSAGQSQMDNRIADFQYSGVIIPQLEFLDSDTCVAFRSDGFSVYTGSASIKESTTVSVKENIQSVFYDTSRIGMIVNNSSGGDFNLLVYHTDGREILNQEFNFAYKSVEFSGDEISLYNGANFCVYNLYGVEKFNGSYSETPQSIFATGRNRYVVVKENSLDMIRLK